MAKKFMMLEYPQAKVESFNAGFVVLKVEDGVKVCRIKMSVHCLHRMMKLAHNIVDCQRIFANGEMDTYQRIKKLTGYQEPSPT